MYQSEIYDIHTSEKRKLLSRCHELFNGDEVIWLQKPNSIKWVNPYNICENSINPVKQMQQQTLVMRNHKNYIGHANQFRQSFRLCLFWAFETFNPHGGQFQYSKHIAKWKSLLFTIRMKTQEIDKRTKHFAEHPLFPKWIKHFLRGEIMDGIAFSFSSIYPFTGFFHFYF